MTYRDAAIGPGAEFDLIRQMKARWGALAVGLGDDAAVLQPVAGEQLVISTDAAIERVHFRRDWLSLRDIGYRATTAALSDLAAMAAAPRGVLVAISLPSELSDVLIELADGIGDAVRVADTVVLGGNLTNGDALAITTTVVGNSSSPLRRAGAQAGDLLYVTGSLGGPRAAVRALKSGASPSSDLLARFARPKARIAEAMWLAARGATAAIDISDGLSGDANHLAAASRVVLEIDVERVPVFSDATEEDALAGGEEFELLVAAPHSFPEAEFSEQFALPLTQVGRVISEQGEESSDVRFTRAGKRVAAPLGYDHFSR